MADDITIDPDDFTIDELEEIEALTGKALPDLFTPRGPSASGLRGALFIVKRRADPEFSWDDASKLSINDMKSAASRPDPTSAASE